MTWDEWARQHFAVFGMSTQADANMLSEWQRLFASAGFTADEVAEATDWVATHDPPRFRSDQLAALQARVRARRAAETTRGPAEPAASSCGLCGGSGVACGLPNPDAMERAGGRWRTCAAYCKCPLGRWRAGRDPGREDWAQYEARVPDWRERLAAHRVEQEAYQTASHRAGTLDREMGELLRKMRSRSGGVN